MKKIGIVTILKTNNYGAELQAYATQEALKKMGYKAEIIDYLFYKNPKHVQTDKSKPVFLFSTKKRLAEWLYPIMEKIKSFSHQKDNKIRIKRFDEFHLQNTSQSKTFQTIDALYDEQLDYDVYMVGSDQVWNPGIYSSLLPYMLDFAPDDKKRIAYASSFGVSAIDESQQRFYKEHLKKFDAIGVREKNAVELVKQISDCDATWVLDPTLLLNANDWETVAKQCSAIDEPYILLYELTPCPYIAKLAYAMSKEKGLQIVRVCKNAAVEDKDEYILNIIDAGPAEFLGLFANADLVITNSFHGTAFSINFNKEFYTITPKRKHNNSRQKSILELFDLEDRLISEDTDINNISRELINYDKVNSILCKEREKSYSFLKKAIDGE